MKLFATFLKVIGRTHSSNDQVLDQIRDGKLRAIIPGEHIPSFFSPDGFEIGKVVLTTLERQAEKILEYAIKNPGASSQELAHEMSQAEQSVIIQLGVYDSFIISNKAITHEDLATSGLKSMVMDHPRFNEIVDQYEKSQGSGTVQEIRKVS